MCRNCRKRCVSPKAHTYPLSAWFVFHFWCRRKKLLYSKQCKGLGKYCVENNMPQYMYICTYICIYVHRTCPSICIICVFRIPIVFTRAGDRLPVSHGDLLNQSFHLLCSDNSVHLLVWNLRLCSLSVSSEHRFCHGSNQRAYGGNSLLGIRSCSIRTSHISRLDEGCFLVDKFHVKCSVCIKMCCSFLCKTKGIPNSLPRLEMCTQVCGWPKMPACYRIFFDLFLINIMLQCIHLSVY